MSKKEPTDILSGMRDTILATALQFKKDKLGVDGKGTLSGYDLNAFSGAMKAAGYIEMIRAREAQGLTIDPEIGIMELSDEDKKRLDDVAKLLSGKPVSKPRQRKKKAEEGE